MNYIEIHVIDVEYVVHYSMERKYAEMKEVKSPKRPLIFYYGIVLVVLLVFNLFITPMLAERQVKEVDYGTFMKMTEDKDIGQVQIDSTQITFTDKAESAIYKTGLMPDDDLTQRLYEAVRSSRKKSRRGHLHL